MVLALTGKEADVPLFRRGRDDDADEPDQALVDDDAADVEVADDEPRPEPGPTSGPWDINDVSDELDRIDLGALHVPVPNGCEVRVEMQDDQVVAATVVDGRSAVTIHAFAAPRSQGIWDEVRDEIAESLRSSNGSAEDVEGPFGKELRARIPAPGPQGPQLQPARFIGVDGPRWFLRGTVLGPAGAGGEAARAVEEAFRAVVVVRGSEPMPVRDPLPLTLPPGAAEQLAGDQPRDA